MIDSYLDNETNINYIEDELLAMIDAIEYAKKLAQKAIQGLLIGRNENPAQVAADFSDYYPDYCFFVRGRISFNSVHLLFKIDFLS